MSGAYPRWSRGWSWFAGRSIRARWSTTRPRTRVLSGTACSRSIWPRISLRVQTRMATSSPPPASSSRTRVRLPSCPGSASGLPEAGTPSSARRSATSARPPFLPETPSTPGDPTACVCRPSATHRTIVAREISSAALPHGPSSCPESQPQHPPHHKAPPPVRRLPRDLTPRAPGRIAPDRRPRPHRSLRRGHHGRPRRLPRGWRYRGRLRHLA